MVLGIVLDTRAITLLTNMAVKMDRFTGSDSKRREGFARTNFVGKSRKITESEFGKREKH